MIELKSLLEALMGFILLWFVFVTSIITSTFLPMILYFSSSDREKLNENSSKICKKQSIREKHLQNFESKYPLTKNGEKILKLSEEKLVKGLQERTLSAANVLECFIAKAIKVNRNYNCVTEFIPKAMEWAKELDQMEQVKGPLHGVPISIKENCNIKGMDTTLGFAQFLFQPAEEDAVIVKVLKDLGAIPFCKTNVPQSLFTYGCGNPIFGDTLNCLNPKLSPGGSSGGESCLIAGGGSILGVGTDVGGSVRIPSHFSGITGMKPTKLRMSMEGFKSTGTVMVPLCGTNGFMAKKTRTLILAYKSLYNSGQLHANDANAIPIPWNDDLFNTERKLRFGYFTSLDYFPVIGDGEEVVLNAKRKLELAGHEVVPFEMPDIRKILDLTFGFTFADLGSVFRKVWKGEPVADAAFATFWMCKLPLWLRKILACIVELKIGSFICPVFYSPMTADLLRAGNDTWKSEDLWKRIVERKGILDEIKNQWKSKEIDVLLSPAFPFSAIPYSLPGKILQAVTYTIPWNMLDFPAGVVKFGTESGKSIDKYHNRGDYILKLAQEGAKESVGMPIAIQIVGLPYQEELVLKAMSIVESLQ